MNRIDLLFEKWAELNDEAEMAIFAYDAGDREEGMAQLEHIWQMFQDTFADAKEREKLDNAYQDTMNMVLNRLYWDMEETGDEERLWNFCSQVCSFFKTKEIWCEDYVVCIGRLLLKREKYMACDQWFERYVAEEPEMPVYIAHWAACLAERGEKEKALDMLDHTMQKIPVCNYGTLSFYRQSRQVYEMLGEKEKAERCRYRIGELDEELLFLDEEE